MTVPFLENALDHTLPLDGDWDFDLAGQFSQRLPVPSAWEAFIPDKTLDGPAHYRREFDVPAEWLDGPRQIVLEAGAVSFDATVRVNGHLAGTHQGLWSPFQIDITALVHPGANSVEIDVWKPGGRFPLRETLSGFLPDVATPFGGIWQSVRLRAFGAALADVRVLADRDGRLAASGQVAGAVRADTVASVALRHPDGHVVREARAELDQATGHFEAEFDTLGLLRWQPASPAIYSVHIEARQGGALVASAARSVGLRDVRAARGNAWLDGQPLHLRGVLDWGWYPRHIRPAPSEAEVRRQFDQARSLGFNLVKLCLVVPDEATFALADQAGMLLWLELPMWLPRLTPAARELALREYADLFRRLHHHPSIVVLSLGCELNAEADAGYLGALHALAREWFPNVLHCDNSGSAEAYGGVQTGLSDFYDYHFYTDPHFFQSLVEHFDRGYRPPRPWLYGEFCDVDTCRDFSLLQPEPWWLADPVALQRDDYLYTRDYRQRLAAAGVNDGGAALTRLARRQAMPVRKFILELTRRHSATGGYVVSGWADTPITTSGMVDDRGELKFPPDEWRPFNTDAVLLLDRERRRRWVGGDRPAYRDPYTWRAGERAEMHALFSNGLGAASGGTLRWQLLDDAGAVLDAGEQPVGALPAAQVSELAVLPVRLPTPAGRPADLRLELELDLVLASSAQHTARNTWPLWVVPQPRLPSTLAVAAPLRYRQDLTRLDKDTTVVDLGDADTAVPFVATEFSGEVLDYVRAGGRGLVWVAQPDERFTASRPFWREAIHVFEDHPLWRRVPHAGHADLRFFSVATDITLELGRLANWLGPEARCRPVWRRFDARALTWAEYVIEVQYGLGRMLVSSLRFDGGLGHQPTGLDQNPWGAWLCASLLAEAQS